MIHAFHKGTRHGWQATQRASANHFPTAFQPLYTAFGAHIGGPRRGRGRGRRGRPWQAQLRCADALPVAGREAAGPLELNGLTAQLSAAVKENGRSPLLDRGLVLFSLAVAIALGASSMSDIAVLLSGA